MIALVTGANQGLGFALAENLAAKADRILLTGRDPERVAAAAARIGGSVEGRVLDVTDAKAVADLAAELGSVDVVFSNAIGPLTPDRPQAEQADEFIDVANGGTHAMLRSFVPILNPGGRFIVVASALGTLGHLDARLHPLFDNVTLDQVEQAVEHWRAAIHAGTAEAGGWPHWINLPSKVAQVAAVRAVAAQRRETDLANGTLIAAVCPGLVNTRASRPWFDNVETAQTPDQAAKQLLGFVLAEADPAAYGELVQFGKVLPWRVSIQAEGVRVEGETPLYLGATMTKVLLTDLVIGESPRWHDGRLWFCHWGPDEVIAMDADGKSEVMLNAPAHSIDWLPDDRMLIVSKQGGLLRQEPSGSLVRHIDTEQGFNEIVVDGRGNIYLNSVGFDFMGFLKGEAEFGTGTITLVTPDGKVTEVADDIHFANGMVVAPDNKTLVISESFARRLTAFDIADDGSLSNRRVWAENVAPDGITMDSDGAIWSSTTDHDVARIKDGGEVLQRFELDRMPFACMLGEGTLYVMAARWNPDNPFGGPRTGQVLAFPASASRAGWPS